MVRAKTCIYLYTRVCVCVYLCVWQGCFRGVGGPSIALSVLDVLPSPQFRLSNRNSGNHELSQSAATDDSEWKFSF